MTAELKSTSEGRTMVLTLSNPEHRNALGPRDVCGRHRGAQRRREQRRGPQRRHHRRRHVFCAGGNLQRLLANREREPAVQAESIDALHSWIEAIRTFPKPVIAAVEGAAAGAGFSLALACDFIVAARDAVFAASYSNVALSPDGGASWRLAQALPRQLASELLMLRRAHRRRAPACAGPGQRGHRARPALDAALALAGKLNERAPNALASIKELLNEARGATLVSAAGAASATTSCATCTTPTPASASRPSWPSRRRATNERGWSRPRQCPSLSVTDKTDHGRPHSYHRGT